MPLAVDEKGNLLIYMNRKYVTREEAFKILPTDNKEECNAVRQKWFDEIDREKH